MNNLTLRRTVAACLLAMSIGAVPAIAQNTTTAPQKLPLENPVVPQPQQPIAEATGAGAQQPQHTDNELVQVAKQIGEEIVGLTSQTPTAPPVFKTGARALAGCRAYKAQEGDTLSKLAGRFMGGNTKANRDEIVNANP